MQFERKGGWADRQKEKQMRGKREENETNRKNKRLPAGRLERVTWKAKREQLKAGRRKDRDHKINSGTEKIHSQ